MKKIGSILILSLSICLSALAQDEAKVLINGRETNQAKISLGQVFTYSVAVSTGDGGNVSDPRLPDLNGFQVTKLGSQVESRSQFINGSFSFVRKQIFNYRLQPLREGQFLLTPAEVTVGAQTLRTHSVNIDVVKTPGGVRPSQPPPPDQNVGDDSGDPFGDDSQDMMDQADAIFNQLMQRNLPKAQQAPDINPNEAFFVRVEIDHTKVYAGEQVTASWYLYTQNNLTNFEPMKYPDLKGFWKEDIEIATQLNFSNVEVKGIPYKKALLMSYALFPIKAGVATIDPFKLRATAIIANPFGMFGKPYTFTKSSTPVKIEVLPIPQKDQPKDFSGAVGSFDMQARVEKTTVAINEPFSLKIRFSGRGNAKQIELPALNLSDDFEQYDSKNDSKFSRDGTSYKEFEVLLIPRRLGDLKIPSLSVSFFNPKTGKFERRTTNPITLKVVAGKVSASQSNPSTGFLGSAQTPSKQELPQLIYQEPRWTMSQKIWNWIWLVLSLVVLIGLGIFYFKEMKNDNIKDKIARQVQKRFKDISKLQGENKLREAAIAVINLADVVLSEISGAEEAHQISDLLNMVPPSLSKIFNDEFRVNLKYFEALGFAPEEATQNLKDPKRFKTELKAIHKKIMEALESTQEIK